MGLLDALLPPDPDEPCAAPDADAIPYVQSVSDAWVVRCGGPCARTVKYDDPKAARAAMRRHNATGRWDVEG